MADAESTFRDGGPAQSGKHAKGKRRAANRIASGALEIAARASLEL
jgi:hypothetical protein